MKYLIAGTWGMMFEDEVQSIISLIQSCEKESTYILLNALYEKQPDMFKENLHAIGLSTHECEECEIAILTFKEKELDKIKAEENFYLNKWSEEGLPDDVKPNINATLKFSDIVSTARFIEFLDNNEKINIQLNIEIGSDGYIRSLNPKLENFEDTTLVLKKFSFDELLSVECPALYWFTNIDKAFSTPSIENVTIFESRKSISHNEPWDTPEYIAGDFDRFLLTFKYNLGKNTIKIVKYEDDEEWFDDFCTQYNLDKAYFINNDIKKYLKSRGYNGKIRILCQVRKRKVVVSHDGNILGEKEILPKLIVVHATPM